MPSQRIVHVFARFLVTFIDQLIRRGPCNSTRGSARTSSISLLALLKYLFYYTIRRGFGNFFGMIHVLTRHLAPEYDRFRFCPGFWSMLCFGRKLNIFGDVLTHGHNWAKMRNKEKRPHANDGTERAQAGQPGAL